MMRDLTVHLPAQERTTICAAWAPAECREDKTAALKLSKLLLVWLRCELSGVNPDLITHNLNAVIKHCKEILA